jgi:hypothetical protein
MQHSMQPCPQPFPLDTVGGKGAVLSLVASLIRPQARSLPLQQKQGSKVGGVAWTAVHALLLQQRAAAVLVV